jgi:hypothetical protein
VLSYSREAELDLKPTSSMVTCELLGFAVVWLRYSFFCDMAHVLGYLGLTICDSILVSSSKVEMSKKNAGEQLDM